jgi:hypothetical protein
MYAEMGAAAQYHGVYSGIAIECARVVTLIDEAVNEILNAWTTNVPDRVGTRDDAVTQLAQHTALRGLRLRVLDGNQGRDE